MAMRLAMLRKLRPRELSPRESDVMRARATGASGRDVAVQLGLSVRAVADATTRARRKIGVNERTHAEIVRVLDQRPARAGDRRILLDRRRSVYCAGNCACQGGRFATACLSMGCDACRAIPARPVAIPVRGVSGFAERSGTEPGGRDRNYVDCTDEGPA